MKEKIKYIIGTIWLTVVMYFYYKNHTYFTESFSALGKWWIIWLAPILSYGIFLFYNWAKGEESLKIKLSAKKISVIFLLTMLFLGNVGFMVLKPLMYLGPTAIYNDDGSVNLNPTQNQLETASHILKNSIVISAGEDFYNNATADVKQYLVKANIWQIEKGLTLTFLKVYLSSTLFLLFCCGLGAFLHKIIRRRQEHEDSFERKMIELILGLLTMTFVFLTISFLGKFNVWVNLGTIGLISILIRKELLDIFKKISSWKVSLEFSYSNLVLPISLFVLGFASIHLMDNLSPMPRGWDGLNRYILVARNIAETGSGVKIGSDYAWELIIAFFYGIDQKIALFWTSLPGILNYIVIFLLLKKFTNTRNAGLVIAFMISMPMMSFYLSDENKIDLAHWLLGSTVLLALLKGLDFEEKIKIKDYSYLWIAAVLSGFAFTVKFTGIILIFALTTTFAYLESGYLFATAVILLSLVALAFQGGFNIGSDFISSESFNYKIEIFGTALSLILAGIAIFKKKLTQSHLRNFIILCLLVAVPILPWMAKNFYESKTFSIANLIQGVTEAPMVDFQASSTLCKSTGFFEEFDRYIGYNDNIFIRISAMPWHLTMSDIGARGAYVDIGYSFLGFILFTILFFKFKDKRKNLVLFFAVIYGFLWLIKANGVIWYGFPLMTFAAIAVALAFEELDKNKFGRAVIILSFLSWGVLSINARLTNFGNAVLLLNHAGLITYDDVQENIFPYADEIHDVLKDHPGLIYKVGTPLGYYIPDFYTRSYDDQLIDDFYCTYISYEQDPIKIIKIFEENNMKFLLFDSYTATIGNDPKGTLHNKVDVLVEFMNKYFDIVVYDDVRGYHLLYIPTVAELLEKHPELQTTQLLQE